MQLRALAEEGLVLVNRTAARPGRRLWTGDWIEILADPTALRPLSAPAPSVRVLIETPTVLVVDKPAGLPCVPDRFRGRDPSLHSLLPGLRPESDLRIVHRLDRDTSGCVVLAKGPDAARHFDRLLRAGSVAKEYLALVSGSADPPALVDLWLGPDRRRPGKVVASRTGSKGFRAALTEIAVERRYARHCLVRLRPKTGRGHQLRVHLSAIGRPIVGDGDYGGEELLLSDIKRRYKQRPGRVERPLLSRMFLHAERLSFADVGGAWLSAVSPLPGDLRQALSKLERYSAGK